MSTISSQAEILQSPTTSSRSLSNPDDASRPSCLPEHRELTAISNLSRFGNEFEGSVTYNIDFISVKVSRVFAGQVGILLTSDQESKLFRIVRSVIFRKAVPTTSSSGVTSCGNRE